MIDCMVVGAGPAGLLTSAALTGRSIEHVVLERSRVGQSWRAQRWDGFRLNTPGWASALFDAAGAGAYFGASAVVERLAGMAATAEVREGVAVHRLDPVAEGFVLETTAGRMRCSAVVVATGDENVPRLPALVRHVPDRIVSLHTAAYRSPDALPPGRVLVVGSGQSGCQIADELLAAGRRVVLATSPVGRVPTRYRGQDAYALLVRAGFFDQSPDALPDPEMLNAPQPILAPDARPLSLQRLARAGARLAGRLTAVDDACVHFDDSAAANAAAGDAFAARVTGMLDGLIARLGIDAPPASPDEADRPAEFPPLRSVDLDDIAAIVWATGFTGEFGWLHPDLLTVGGRPRHDGIHGAAPGLIYVGLRWLTRRNSATLLGMPADAAAAAQHVHAVLTGKTVPR